jgi:hypothetical protein
MLHLVVMKWAYHLRSIYFRETLHGSINGLSIINLADKVGPSIKATESGDYFVRATKDSCWGVSNTYTYQNLKIDLFLSTR